MNPLKIAFAVLFCLMMLTGCAQVQLRTAWALRDLDYLTVNPAVVRLALALPAGAQLDHVTLSLQFERDGTLELDRAIDFDIVTSGREVDRVGFPTGDASRVVLRIPVSRLEDVVNYQRTLFKAREAGIAASASIGVDSRLNQQWVRQYCAAGNRGFRVQAWILVDDNEGFLPLVGENEITSLLDGQSQGFCPDNTEN